MTKHRWLLIVSLVVGCVTPSPSTDESTAVDAGQTDGAVVLQDAGTSDAGHVDGSVVPEDAGSNDAGQVDGSVAPEDAGTVDAAQPDGSIAPEDAGTSDAGLTDGSLSAEDAGTSDAGQGDAAVSPGDAGTNNDFQRRLEELASPYVNPAGATGKAIGIVVAVSSPTTRMIIGLGATSLGGQNRPEASTIFEIGSVTKVYTGVLFGLEFNRGNIQLEDLIDPYFPAGAPQFNSRSISLLDLATHTSGLPDMPTNLHGEPGNPAAGYTAQDLANFMASHSLTVEPGSAFQYSNVGAGTLGHLLVLSTASVSYEALVKSEIADRLGISDTTITLTTEQQARCAQGYRNGLPAPANKIGDPLVGSGALRATGDDVLRFVEAALGTGSPELVAAWQSAMEPRRPSGLGQNGRTGFLLNVEDYGGRTVYSKNGQTAGFNSQVLFTTTPPAAVVLLTNTHEVTSPGGLRQLGLAILDEIP